MAKKTTYELALEIGAKIQNSFDKSVGSVNKKLESVGNVAKTAAKVATAAFAAVKIADFAKGATETYAEFNQAMASTSAVAGANAEEMKKLEAAALEMGKKTTKTATEASEALGYMALAGWDVETSISALEPVLRLSEATQMDLATCSDLVTDSMSALGLTTDELSGYLDVACKANNKSNQTAQHLMEAYIGCGGVLNNLNISVQDSATALGVLANRGIKGSEAGNKLNSVLINLTSGTGQAGEKMEELGISAFDSEGNFIGLEKTLRLLDNALAGLTEEERNAALAAIGGKTQIDTLNDLLSGLNTTTEDGRTEWAALNAELKNADGAMMDMAAQMTDTLAGSIAVFGSAVDDAKIRLCNIFAPMAKDAIKTIADTIPSITEKVAGFTQNLYNKAVPALVNFKDNAIEAFNKAKPVVEDFKNKVIEVFNSAKPTIEDLKNKLVSAFWFLANTGKTAFENIKAKIEENKPVIDKVIAVAIDLKDKLFEAWENAKPAISYVATVVLPAAVDAIMKVIDAAATVYQKLDEWGLLIPIITGIATAITAVKLVNLAKDAMNTVKGVKALITVFAAQKKAMLENLALKIKDKKETAQIYGMYAKDEIVKKKHAATTWMQTTGTKKWNAVCKAGSSVTKALGAAFTFLTSPIGLAIIAITAIIAVGVLLWKNWDTVKEKLSQAGECIAGVFGKLKEGAAKIGQAIADAFSSMKQKVSEKIQEFGDKISEIWSNIANKASEIWQTITNIIKVGVMLIGEIISAAFQIITMPFQFIWQNCKDFVIIAWDFIKEIVQNALSKVKEIISSFMSPIVNGISTVWTAISSATSTAWAMVTGYISSKLNAAKQAVLTIANAIKSTVSAVWTAVSSATSTAWAMVTGYISSKLNAAKQAVLTIVNAIKSTASAAWTAVSSATSTAWEMVTGCISSKLNAARQAVSSVIGNIKSTFSSGLSAVKNTVTSIFGNIINAISQKMESAKSVVQNAINTLKDKFNFSWKFPKLKLPHFSIKGDFSINPPSVPKFAIEWYKNGGILNRPTIFGASGNTLLGGGEAGKEAVLPLSELWANMKTVVAGVVNRAPDGAASMLDNVKELVGIESDGQQKESITKQLYNNISTNNTVNKSKEVNSTNESSKIVYSPNVIIQGNADKKDVETALDMSQAKFNQMMAEYQRQKGRTSFA